jgi:hypothetical protein
MDKFLQNLQHGLSLIEVEYQQIEAKYAQIKSHQDYLEKARDDAKKMISEREEILRRRFSNGSDFDYKSNIGEMPKSAPDRNGGQSPVAESNDKEKSDENESEPGGQTPPAAEEDGKPLADITSGMFVGMKLIDAVVKLLRLVKIPQSTRQICDALLRGGYHTTAHDFTDTVRSTLKQYKHPNGPMFWIDNKWELKEWIPGS